MAGKKISDWLRMSEAVVYYYKRTGHKMFGRDTARNWIKTGKRGYDGEMVKLQGERRGGLWFTRKVWVDAFISRMRAPETGGEA